MGFSMFFYKPSSYSIGVPPWLRVSPIQIGDPWVAQGEMSNARVTAWASQFLKTAKRVAVVRARAKGCKGYTLW